MVSLGVPPLPPPYALAPTFSSQKVPPLVPVEGGRNYTKIPLSSGEEKHVYTYTIMNTARNKNRTKHFEKGKTDFFTIQPVIEYIPF